MNYKKLAGVVTLLIGSALILFSVYAMNRIASAKGAIHSVTRPFSEVPGGRMVGGALESEASQYDATVRLCLIGGILLVIIGGGVTVYYRKRS